MSDFTSAADNFTPRLCASRLQGLPPSISRPDYARPSMKLGVVHFGLGAFHRAHQAVVFDCALSDGDLRWGVTAVSLRSVAVRDQLAPQDELYTVQTRDSVSPTIRCIGAIGAVLVAPESPSAVITALSNPDVHLVTLTITEKGYHLDSAKGEIDLLDPQIAADLAHPEAPSTAAGFIVAALKARRALGIPPFTTLSCDNLSANGDRLKASVIAMASAGDHDLGAWIDHAAAFPNTMVDRIVPATTAEDVAWLQTISGVQDLATVKTEPFFQWVIEDRFKGPHPDFARFGVQLTQDVRPWEDIKLRLLNGAHSAIAYLSRLAGIQHVHEALANPYFFDFIEVLWEESLQTLTPPAELDVSEYCEALMKRFQNSTLQHATAQIACDGSQKMPRRLLDALGIQVHAGGQIDALSLAVAGWMKWLCGQDESGREIIIIDPFADRIQAHLQNGPANAHPVERLLQLDWLFPKTFAADPRLRSALLSNFDLLSSIGVNATLRSRFAP